MNEPCEIQGFALNTADVLRGNIKCVYLAFNNSSMDIISVLNINEHLLMVYSAF